MSKHEPGTIVAGRVGNAGGVVIGYGNGETFIASDLPALLPHTQPPGVPRSTATPPASAPADVTYCHDGIADQPRARRREAGPALRRQGQLQALHAERDRRAARGPPRHDPRPRPLRRVPRRAGPARADAGAARRDQRVLLVGMGTSLHSAMVGRHYMEQIAGIPAEYDNASELRYRDADHRPRDAGRLRHPVRRDRRHPGRDGGGEAARAPCKSRSPTSPAARPAASPTPPSTPAAASRSASPAPRRTRRPSSLCTCSRSTSPPSAAGSTASV